jgi:capsid portal protein
MTETRRRRAPAPVLTIEGQQLVTFKGAGTANDGDEVLQLVQKGEVSQQIVDIFKQQNLYGEGGDLRIVSPPVSLPVLLRFPNDSSILRQCIEAMVINIEGHGYRLEYIGEDGQEQSDAAVQEATLIEGLLDQLNPDISITDMRKRTRWDIETLGFGFWEVGRSRDGKPSFLSHLPGHTVRMTTVDPTPVQVDIETTLFGKKVVTSVTRRFRRFVQIVGSQKIYFKEFGDPRSIDPATGLVKDSLPYEQTATEVIAFNQYYPGQLYGLPRWFNNMVAIHFAAGRADQSRLFQGQRHSGAGDPRFRWHALQDQHRFDGGAHHGGARTAGAEPRASARSAGRQERGVQGREDHAADHRHQAAGRRASDRCPVQGVG